MPEKLQIWNMALGKMGQSRQLLDLESMSTPEHRMLDMLYRPTIDAMLEDHSWSFAKRMAKLTPTLLTYSHPLWAHFFDYPRHCLDIRILSSSMLAEDTEELGYFTGAAYGPPLRTLKSVQFEVVSYDPDTKLICTNAPDVWAEYIISDVEESSFPPMFVNALTYRLGAELSLALAGDIVKHSELMKYYNAIFERGKERSSNESMRIKTDDISRYERSRR